MLHSPFSGTGLVFKENENQDQVRYQAAHHQLVAGALATKIAHEVDLQNQVGRMLAGGNFYPYSCRPENVWAALEKDRGNLFFIDVQAHDAYPAYSACVFHERGVTINKAPGGDEVLKDAIDFISFSHYASRYASTEMNTSNSSAASVVKSLCDPYLRVGDWGWEIDPLGLHITMNMIYNHYQEPLFLVEDSLGAKDELAINGEIDDNYRISYLREYIRAMGEAIADGIPLMGYTIWGCIDLVSVSIGETSKHYGFIYVDRNNASSGTLTRTRKESFWWYKKVVASDGEDLEQVTVPDAA